MLEAAISSTQSAGGATVPATALATKATLSILPLFRRSKQKRILLSGERQPPPSSITDIYIRECHGQRAHEGGWVRGAGHLLRCASLRADASPPSHEMAGLAISSRRAGLSVDGLAGDAPGPACLAALLARAYAPSTNKQDEGHWRAYGPRCTWSSNHQSSRW